MPDPLEETWSEYDRKLLHLLTLSEYRGFGFHRNDPEVNQVISGYNARTFPQSHRWIDQYHNVWRRAGLYVFDCKLKKGEVPDGVLYLTRESDLKKIVMVCEIVTLFMNQYNNIEEAVTVENEDRVLSRVCGRATLNVLDAPRIMRIPKNKRRRPGGGGA